MRIDRQVVSAFVVTVIELSGCGVGGGGGGGSNQNQNQNTVPGAPTNVVGTAGNAQVSVAFTAPASNGGAVITSYTVTASPGAITATGTASPIVVTGLTNGTAYTFTVTATNSVGTGPASAASAAVTPVVPTPTLTSISPSLNWLASSREFITFTLTGVNFTSDSLVNYDAPYPLQTSASTFVNSTTITFMVVTDPQHNAYGEYKFKVCKADGVTCSSSVPAGFYGANHCGVTPTGEKLCFNPQETVAGQQLDTNGNPLNGYVDKFKPITGALDGKCFVGAPVTAIAVDDTTGWFSAGSVSPIDPTTCAWPPSAAGSMNDDGDQGQGVAYKAKNGFFCRLKKTSLACISWLGGPQTANPLMFANFGTNLQSLAMGVTNNKTYAYVHDAGGQAIFKVDVSNGNIITSWPVTGITAGAPRGSEIVLFDSLGLGMLVSYGNNLAIVFDESTLKTTATILLPGTPGRVVANGSVAVVGNADVANSVVNFTVVDPVKGTATAIPSARVLFLPVNLVPAITVDGTGVDFYACPNDGVSSCSSFTIPK